MVSSFSTELSQVQDMIDKGLVVIRSYEWLLDSYVLDFYTESHWQKVPNSWLDTLTNIDLPDLARFVNPLTPEIHSRVWPLSLLALRETITQLSVPRHKFQHQSGLKPSTFQDDGHEQTDTGKDNSFVYSSCERPSSRLSAKEMQDKQDVQSSISIRSHRPTSNKFPCLPSSKIANIFNKHVTFKKRHEIMKMAQITAETAQQCGCDIVLDIGSGRGHLARKLAYDNGLKVCCLEAQSSLLLEASRFDLELEKSLSKHFKPDQIGPRPVHLNLTLSHLTTPQQIMEGLKTAFGKVAEDNLRFGIVGLHPCGDLATILIRLFTNCPEAMFINIVGCCFMKLTTDPCGPFLGYPMSSYLLSRISSSDISYIARELACHALETYCCRLLEGKYSDLKVHCYRATLEEIIGKNWPSLKHSSIKSVKYTKEMTFSEYCKAALSKLSVIVPEDDITSKKTLQNLFDWKKVVILFTLRLLLAPLVETVILLDRLLYIREHGVRSKLIPVFDPKLSPRNHILIAQKTEEGYRP